MNLLDKYMEEIGKQLPRKDRFDLQAEIRSTIEDMLEDRSQQSGKLVDEGLTSEVLQEFGSPTKVAASYKPTRYLIGPRLYPFFMMVLKIVFTVLTTVLLVGFGIQFFSSGANVNNSLSTIGKFGLQYLSGIISAFGNIVLVFAIMERALPASEFEDEADHWKPSDLEVEPDPEQVKRGETIFAILITMLGLAVFNLYPNLIGIGSLRDGNWIFIPALSEAFFYYLPWINILGVLQILLNLFLLRRGLWQTANRLFNLGLEIGGVILACVMFSGPSLVNLSAGKLAAVLGQASLPVLTLFNNLPWMILGILIIVQSIEVLQDIWKMMIKKRNHGSYPINGEIK